MFLPIFRIVTTFALGLVLLSPPAHADANQTDAPFSKLTSSLNAKTIVSLAYAPDGQTLWSLNKTDDLQIWLLANEQLVFESKLPRGMRELRVMQDGSLLVRSSEGDLFWYEQPQPGQPLKVKREFIRPEPFASSKRWLALVARLKPSEQKAMMGHWTSSDYNGGDMAVAPDEKRVAVSTVFNSVQGSSGVIVGLGDLALVNIWNLESGAMESQTRLHRPMQFITAEEIAAMPNRVNAPSLPFRPTLTWNKAGTLQIRSGDLFITPTF